MNLHPTKPDRKDVKFEGRRWHLREFYSEEDDMYLFQTRTHWVLFDFEDEYIATQQKFTRKTSFINLPYAKQKDQKLYNKYMEENKLWRRNIN